MVSAIDGWQARPWRRAGTRFVFAADELYLRPAWPIAGRGGLRGLPGGRGRHGPGAPLRATRSAARVRRRRAGRAGPGRRGDRGHRGAVRPGPAPTAHGPRCRALGADGRRRCRNEFFGPAIAVAGLLTGRGHRPGPRRAGRSGTPCWCRGWRSTRPRACSWTTSPPTDLAASPGGPGRDARGRAPTGCSSALLGPAGPRGPDRRCGQVRRPHDRDRRPPERRQVDPVQPPGRPAARPWCGTPRGSPATACTGCATSAAGGRPWSIPGAWTPAAARPSPARCGRQVLTAIAEADALLFVVDARDGRHGARRGGGPVLLRRPGKPVLLVANKVGRAAAQDDALRRALPAGHGDRFPVSAEHGRGVAELLEALRRPLPGPRPPRRGGGEPAGPASRSSAGPTWASRRWSTPWSGAERVVVHAEPGTTRDAVDTPVTVTGPPVPPGRHGRAPAQGPDGRGPRQAGRGDGSAEHRASATWRWSCSTPASRRGPGRAGSPGMPRRPGAASCWSSTSGTWSGAPTGRPELIRATAGAPAVPGATRRSCFVVGARAAAGLDLLVDGDRARWPTSTSGGVHRGAEPRAERRHGAPAARRSVQRQDPQGLYYATQIGTRPPTFLLFVNDPAALHFSYERYLVSALREAFGLAGVVPRFRLRRRRPARSAALP